MKSTALDSKAAHGPGNVRMLLTGWMSMRSRDVFIHDEPHVRRGQPRVPPHAPPAAAVAVLLTSVRRTAAAALVPAPAAVVPAACCTPPRITASAAGRVGWPVVAAGRGLTAAAPTAGRLGRARPVLLRPRTGLLRVRRFTPRPRSIAVSGGLLPAAGVAGLPEPPTAAGRVPAGIPAAPATRCAATPPAVAGAGASSAAPSAAI